MSRLHPFPRFFLSLALGLAAAFGVQAREMVSVQRAEVNLRAGAGTQHEALWVLSRGYPLEVTGRKGQWLKVRDFDGRNRANPAFATLEAFDASGAAVTGGVPEQKLTLKLTMVGGSAETYPAIQYDDNGQPVRDADGALVTEEETEELLYSWYATGGNIDRSRTVTDDLFDQRENEFTLPEEPGPVRLYVIARDGRGGFAVRSLDLQVSEP